MFVRLNFILVIILALSGCKSADEYLFAGKELSSSGNYPDAIRCFDQAILKDPFLKDAYILKGQCQQYLNQYDSAICEFRKLLHFDPDNTAAFYYSGICKYRQNKMEEAIEWFNRALDTKGGFDVRDTSSIKAILDIHKDEIETDEAEFDIPSREILYDRGMAYYKTGKMKNAFYDFNSCVYQNYNSGLSHYMIGLCLRVKKEKKHARAAFTLAPPTSISQ